MREEGIQLIKQFLGANFIIRRLAHAGEMVTVVQWQQVIEGRGTLTIIVRLVLHPAVQHGGIVIDRGAIKRQQNRRQACLIHQRHLHAAVVADLFEEITKHAVVIHHQLLGEAQFGQVIKQVALGAGCLVEIFMRCLTAARA